MPTEIATPISEDPFILPRPWVTQVLLTINVMFYLVLWVLSARSASGSQISLTGDQSWSLYLAAFGSKSNDLIAQGEYWRLMSPAFLHASLLHLGCNSLALYYMGSFVEILIGKGPFLFVYALSTMGGTVGSFLFTEAPSVGASGAIFGLAGSLIAWGYWMKGAPGARDVLKNAVSFCILNIVLGYTIPNVDNYAHLGGLIAGLLSLSLMRMAPKVGLPFNVVGALFGWVSAIALFGSLGVSIQQGVQQIDALQMKVTGVLEATRLQNEILNGTFEPWREAYNDLVKHLQTSRLARAAQIEKSPSILALMGQVRERHQNLSRILADASMENPVNVTFVARALKRLVDIPPTKPDAAGLAPTQSVPMLTRMAYERRCLEEVAREVRAWQLMAEATLEIQFNPR